MNNSFLIEIHNLPQLDYFLMEMEVVADHDGEYKHWWLGGTDKGREGRWVWMNTLSVVEDFVWWSREPNGGLAQNCLYKSYVNSYTGLADVLCNNAYYPVCQIII